MYQQNFAVMLNANARKVNSRVRGKIEQLVAPEDIYYSHSEDESKDIVAEIADRGYPTVFTGGGDGTLCQFLNDYADVRRPTSFAAEAPNIGVLHLGTGNAVASIVSSSNYACDLQSYMDRRSTDFHKMWLVQAEGKRFPFGGLGLDAEILNDYMFLKQNYASNKMLKPLLQNLGGYFAALATRTIPRATKRLIQRKHNPDVRITNMGSEAYMLHGGQAVKAFAPGEVMYEGPSNITMFGTCPYYGHGFTVMPHAMTRPGFFQLRTVTMGIPRVLANLPKIWKGTYEGDGIFDWHAQHVKLDFSEKVPYQYGGDAMGYRDSVEVKTEAAEVVNLVRFI